MFSNFLLIISSIAELALDFFLVREQSAQDRRAERRRKGLCATCGYDVRGSPGLRCPECNGLIRVVGRERF